MKGDNDMDTNKPPSAAQKAIGDIAPKLA